MAYRRNPGLLHSLPALLIGLVLVVGGIALFLNEGLTHQLVRTARYAMPEWAAVLIAVALGAAILAFGILSLRQTWREVRHRPTRDQWLGY